MVGVVAGTVGHVQREQRVHGEGAKELLEQLGVDLAQALPREAHVPGQKGPAGEVHRGVRERLVHRHRGLAEAADAALVPDRLGEGAAQHDADVLGGVVAVDVQVARRPNREVEQAVPGERHEHVVEEADPAVDLGRTRAVEIDGERDVGFRGRARDSGDSAHARSTTAASPNPPDVRSPSENFVSGGKGFRSPPSFPRKRESRHAATVPLAWTRVFAGVSEITEGTDTGFGWTLRGPARREARGPCAG